MNQRDDALLGEFLAECQEHLTDIEEDLLAMEAGGADIDEQLVNKVFRAAHSIKGGAGFFNLTKIQELAHRTENVLDMVRSREMVPTPEAINILLLSFDRLREMIRRHDDSNHEDIGEIVVALSGLASSFLPPEEKATLTTEVVLQTPGLPDGIKVPEFDLARLRREGNFVYRLQVDLIHDVQRRGKTPLDLLHSLLEVGSILDVQMDLESAGTLEDEGGNALFLQVVYASIMDPDMVGTVSDVPAERIALLETPASAEEPVDEEPVESAPARAPEVGPPILSPPSPVPASHPSPPPVPRRTAAPAVASASAAGTEEAGRSGAGPSDSTLRVPVVLLERLMNLAGELVLSRNQLNEAIMRNDLHAVQAGAQRVNLVTSELQEAVMLTRMQPIGNLFGKFPRLVRDLSRELGKEIQLEITGREVELDKTLLEGLSDPLTHMVRNAVDHGSEQRDVRLSRGKSPVGNVRLRAYHEAGQVMIEIADDGAGIDTEKVAAAAVTRGLLTREQVQAMSEREKRGLIFLPGLSTAAQVSDVSGRGVGMDVVKTNLDRLGGVVEIDSTAGLGTTFRIKLPLTLAIIPSLLVSVEDERFAVPQINVVELLRLPRDQIRDRIELVGDAEVIVLRDQLIPLVEVSGLIGGEDGGQGRMRDRRAEAGQDLKVVVVSAGSFVYGLVVDELHDSLEIVVKPLGRHLKGLREYAGATILGDGRVALILDAAGLANVAGLSSLAGTERGRELAREGRNDDLGESLALLVFENGVQEHCAVPLSMVTRIERIDSSQIEWAGGRRTMQYRGASLPLITLADAGAGAEIQDESELVVIVFHLGETEIGLLAAMPVDVIETRAVVDRTTLSRAGISGSAILNHRTTLMVDLGGLVQSAWPAFAVEPPAADEVVQGDGPMVLLAEDSSFFRAQVKGILEGAGYRVAAGEDGQAAWELLERLGDEVQLVVTDIEMPRMTGLELTRKIRGDTRFSRVPVISLSSLASEEDIARAREIGVDDYQIKIDRDLLLESIRTLLGELAQVA